MPNPLPRGTVVARAGRWCVVWQDGPALVLLPIVQPHHVAAFDVPLTLGDMVLGTVTRPDLVVRTRRIEHARDGWARTGTLSGETMCRVVHQLLRAEAHAATIARWSHDVRHQRAARERPVNLVRA